MKLLLHTCCAPCSIYCIKTLREEGIEPTLYWYNPNIHPYAEYKARRDCLKEYADSINAKLVLDDVYGLDEFCRNVSDKIDQRCERYCYPKRLRQAFEYAKENGYDAISTTLLYSIYQKHDFITELMFALAEEYGIEFVYRDFREGWREGQDAARNLGLYMQKYCGCVFSEEEGGIGREVSRAMKKIGISPTNANARKVIEECKENGELKLDNLESSVRPEIVVKKELRSYVENTLFPEYALNDNGHNLRHIKYVIRRSFQFAAMAENVNLEMVYLVAAYHDIAHHIDAKNHEKISSERLRNDEKIREFFSEEQIKIMSEAVYDHRSSMDGEPRSIYGRIVSSADRNTDIDEVLRRCYSYRIYHSADESIEEVTEESRKHVLAKFGAESGYAKDKMFFEDSEYDRFLHEITKLAKQKDKFIKRFNEVNGL